MQKAINISAHITEDLADKLNKVCEYEERPKSFYIKKALEKYLNERLEDIEDYYEANKAYQEFKNSGEDLVTLDEVMKNID
jgi:predicted DNA-binding protein